LEKYFTVSPIETIISVCEHKALIIIGYLGLRGKNNRKIGEFSNKNSYRYRNIVTEIKRRKIIGAGLVESMNEVRKAYETLVLVGKL
jgi:hypothetical protein